MEGADEVVGTLANCGGGVTPWNTILTCEENFQDYYGQRTDDQGEPGQGTDDAPEALEIADTYRWLDDPASAQPPEHYGWVVEVDPFDPGSRPRKHTWLGRVRHENAAINVSESGKVVVYTGHDEEDRCIYKFVSSGTYDPDDREANLDLLSDGMLYVANFATGTWVPMDFENNPVFRDNGYESQAEVLVRTIDASTLEDPETETPIGTPMDRCEDIDVHPETGQVYAALTNNENHGNFYGQILRITEDGDDPTSEAFTYEVFAAGGPQTGFASPDNLAFDTGREPLGDHGHIQQLGGVGHLHHLQEQRGLRDARELGRRDRRHRGLPVRQQPGAGGANRAVLHPGRPDPLSRRPAPRRGEREPGRPHQHLARRRRAQVLGDRHNGLRVGRAVSCHSGSLRRRPHGHQVRFEVGSDDPPGGDTTTNRCINLTYRLRYGR